LAHRWIKILIAVILALLAVELGMIAYDRWFAEGAVPDRSLYPSRGIDISHHNGDINFDKLSSKEADVDFVYIKATEGTDFVDPEFIGNARRSVASGIPTGAYHFFRYDTDGEMQALNFLHAMRGRGFKLPPAIDVEDWGNPDGHEKALIVERLRALTDALMKAGYTPIIYTNIDGYHRLIRGNFDNLPLWISSFSYPPLDTDPENRCWTIWQYSHRGDIRGISSPTDLNVINPSNPLL
jgi:lysozyme